MDDVCQIFVSVGSTATDVQEKFVCAVEDRLHTEGLVPHTVGRNTFSSDAPLKAVAELMDRCTGVVVIAFERKYFPTGLERRGGPKQAEISDERLPTPWNQIEAALAYARGLPLLVIVEEGLRSEGLLEPGYDWYVQSVALDSAALSTREFNGVLADWKERVKQQTPVSGRQKDVSPDVEQMSVGQLVGSMKPSQLWSVLVALAGALAGAFGLGAKLFSHK